MCAVVRVSSIFCNILRSSVNLLPVIFPGHLQHRSSPCHAFEALILVLRNGNDRAVTEAKRKDKAFAGLELSAAQVFGDKRLIAGALAVLVQNQTPDGRLAAGGGFDAVAFGAFVAADFGQ